MNNFIKVKWAINHIFWIKIARLVFYRVRPRLGLINSSKRNIVMSRTWKKLITLLSYFHGKKCKIFLLICPQEFTVKFPIVFQNCFIFYIFTQLFELTLNTYQNNWTIIFCSNNSKKYCIIHRSVFFERKTIIPTKTRIEYPF